jgi:hypothetical protein
VMNTFIKSKQKMWSFVSNFMGTKNCTMAYKDILRNGIRTFEDLEKWLIGQKAKVDPRLRDVIGNRTW